MSSEALKRSHEVHVWLLDCLKIARRAVDQENIAILRDTAFGLAPKDQAAVWIDEARAAADELAIVGLWAWFERHLIEYTQDRVAGILASSPASFSNELHREVHKHVEYWRLDELLELFKSIVEGSQIGNAKQIKHYRDWIVHRNPDKNAPSPPADAYSLLLAIIDAVEQASNATP